jgi:S-adenosylhomocysteine hydrolase
MGANVVPSTEYRALVDLAIAWTHTADTMDKSFANAVSTYSLITPYMITDTYKY